MIDLLRKIPEGFVHLEEEDDYYPDWDLLIETWKGSVFFKAYVYRCVSTKEIEYIIQDD